MNEPNAPTDAQLVTNAINSLTETSKHLVQSLNKNAELTLQQVSIAVKLNKRSVWYNRLALLIASISLVIACLVLNSVGTQHSTLNTVQDEVSAIHDTQTTNSGLTKTDNEILKQVLSVTNPQSETANNQRILQLFTHLELCLENHGDRAREQIAHLPLKALVKGCAADGT